PLKTLSNNPNVMAMPHVAAAVRKAPNEMTGSLSLDVECTSLRGGGVGGRVSFLVSVMDAQGVLQFARKPAEAPIIHLDGPRQATFYLTKQTWRGGREQDTVLCVGTPGHGPGTFAMVKYDGTIPSDKHPTIEATYKPKDPARQPLKEHHELKERC